MSFLGAGVAARLLTSGTQAEEPAKEPKAPPPKTESAREAEPKKGQVRSGELENRNGEGKLVYSLMDRDRRHHSLLANPDGSEAEKLPIKDGSSYRLSPDRKWLLYHRLSDVQQGDHFLSILNLKEKQSIDLEHNARGSCWTPDGKWVLFACAPKAGKTEVVAVNAYGNDRKVLFRLNQVAHLDDCSPDGKRLLLTIEGKGKVEVPPIRQPETDIYVIDINGRNSTNLTKNKALDLRARFSPDGKKILFVSTRSGTSQVHLMDGDGQNEKQLTSFPVEEGRITGRIAACCWSPDGRKIAYSWTNFPKPDQPREPSRVYIANADGSGASALQVGDREEPYGPEWR